MATGAEQRIEWPLLLTTTLDFAIAAGPGRFSDGALRRLNAIAIGKVRRSRSVTFPGA